MLWFLLCSPECQGSTVCLTPSNPADRPTICKTIEAMNFPDDPFVTFKAIDEEVAAL
jgi:hypothetical protein